MKLYQMHCGYYDKAIMDGIYEFHVNIFVVADSPEAAKQQVKRTPAFIAKKMHVDGTQVIDVVDGYKIVLEESVTAL